MSIIHKRFSAVWMTLATILFLNDAAASQTLEVVIKVLPATARVEGRVTPANRSKIGVNWSFLQSIGSAENLGARVADFNLADGQNRAVSFRKLADGEYLAESEAEVFSYSVNLKPPANSTAAAHVSWLSGEKGILMLDDLLPQFAGNQFNSARVRFDLPAGWTINSSEKHVGENVFETQNVTRAVFLVARNPRVLKSQIGETNLQLAITGEWQFSDAEAAKMAGDIFAEYRKLLGETPPTKAQICLLDFPGNEKFGRWTAETRGATVTIISAGMPFKNQSLQLLHEQLRHEILHLWMPNNLALTGNYDWFYEGFTIYQALRTGVALNQIRFEDYLDTLAQAYNLDGFQETEISLLEAAKNRLSGQNRQVYARGMLAAFLCDVALLRSRGGKHSVSTILREIYQKHRVPNQSADGNAASLDILKNYPELTSIVEKYVAGAEKINWKNDLESLGIEATGEDFNVRLKIKAELNRRQKDLLNELGYNNWRKMSENSK